MASFSSSRPEEATFLKKFKVPEGGGGKDSIAIKSRGEHSVRISNLERVLWPESGGLTKYDLISYLISVAPFLLPHLQNRPLVLRRFPKGIEGAGFYQKNCPQGHPPWIETFQVLQRDDKITNYIIAANVETLIWIGNQAAIEFHPWLSQQGTPPDNPPDFAVFDLDPPMEKSTFDDVLEIARALHECLAGLHIRDIPKLRVPREYRYLFLYIHSILTRRPENLLWAFVNR